MLNYFSKHLTLIVSILIFSFIFYIGCSTTEIGRLKGEDISKVTVDSFYYAVTKKNDTINFVNTTPKIWMDADTYDNFIEYKIKDSTSIKRITKTINPEALKFLYAKYTHTTGWDILKTVGIIIGTVAFLVIVLFIIILSSGNFSLAGH